MAIDRAGLNLAFRLLRLTAPTLHASLPSLTQDLGDAVGFSPALQLPNARADVLLGETYTCYMRLINLADAALLNVAVKCEVSTGRQRLTLHDTAAKPMPRLEPGDSYDAVLRHDVKEPNDHLIICSATYTAPDGNLHSEQQTISFPATSPLSIRTKTRTAASSVFLEVCVENTNKTAPIFLDYVRLEPSGSGPVEQLGDVPEAAVGAASPAAAGDAAAFVLRRIEQLSLVQPGGAWNLLYRLPRPPPLLGGGKADLGRLEIKWRRSMGEAGRLQTQHIMMSTAANLMAVEMQLADVPVCVRLEAPFAAKLALRNNLDRSLGPLHIGYSALSLGAAPPFEVLGLQDATVRELAALSTASVPLTVLPLVAGVHSLSGLKLLEASGKMLTSLEASGDILVQMDAGS